MFRISSEYLKNTLLSNKDKNELKLSKFKIFL